MRHYDFGQEYKTLREKAKREGIRMYSKDPEIKAIGEMSVNRYGMCEIQISSPETIDYDGLVQYIRDNSIQPKPKLLHRIANLFFPDFSIDESFFPKNQWNVRNGEEESYGFILPRRGLCRAAVYEYTGSAGTNHQIIFWSRGILGENILAEVDRHEYLLDSSHNSLSITIHDTKYPEDFIDLLFGTRRA